MSKVAVFLEPKEWKIVISRLRRGGEGETASRIINDLETQVAQGQSEDHRLSGTWLDQADQERVAELWRTPKIDEEINPRVVAIQLIRKAALKFGWELGLTESVKIKDEITKRITGK